LFEQFRFPAKQTSCDEDIISITRSSDPGFQQGLCRFMVQVEKGYAYKYREPGPYWPDKENSQMTCKTGLVLLVAVWVALRFKSVSSTTVEGSAGIVRGPQDSRDWCGSEGNGQTRWQLCVIYLLCARCQRNCGMRLRKRNSSRPLPCSSSNTAACFIRSRSHPGETETQ